ncbi:unnamed protein product [Amoebophrya sp. A25]|nr:unnamed protein product [Amoebophrya sp. A25]|eukprot:GSA25T00024579001.1
MENLVSSTQNKSKFLSQKNEASASISTTIFGSSVLINLIEKEGLKVDWRTVRVGKGHSVRSEIMDYLYIPKDDKIIDSKPTLFLYDAPQAMINLRLATKRRLAGRPMNDAQAFSWLVRLGNGQSRLACHEDTKKVHFGEG